MAVGSSADQFGQFEEENPSAAMLTACSTKFQILAENVLEIFSTFQSLQPTTAAR